MVEPLSRYMAMAPNPKLVCGVFQTQPARMSRENQFGRCPKKMGRVFLLLALCVSALAMIPKAPKSSMFASSPPVAAPVAPDAEGIVPSAPPSAASDAVEESQPASVAPIPLAHPLAAASRMKRRPVVEPGMAESLEGAHEQLEKLEHPVSHQEKLGSVETQPKNSYSTGMTSDVVESMIVLIVALGLSAALLITLHFWVGNSYMFGSPVKGSSAHDDGVNNGAKTEEDFENLEP